MTTEILSSAGGVCEVTTGPAQRDCDDPLPTCATLPDPVRDQRDPGASGGT